MGGMLFSKRRIRSGRIRDNQLDPRSSATNSSKRNDAHRCERMLLRVTQPLDDLQHFFVVDEAAAMAGFVLVDGLGEFAGIVR
jgi:hypothetical protein